MLKTPRRHYGPVCVLISALAVTVPVTAVDVTLMREQALARYGAETAEAVSGWHDGVTAVKSSPDETRGSWANEHFNKGIAWSDDMTVWGQVDYWATPLEVMGRGLGDCEDYAIAKYMTLVQAGVEIEKLRITYVKLLLDGKAQAHMVLAYYPEPGAEPLILDNINPRILPASQRKDLSPVYGFNSRQLWTGSSAAPTASDPLARLSRWRDLLSRASAEGLG